jgi:hypothetical protein
MMAETRLIEGQTVYPKPAAGAGLSFSPDCHITSPERNASHHSRISLALMEALRIPYAFLSSVALAF